MKHCRYYKENESSLDQSFELAHPGYFMGFGVVNQETVAIVMNKATRRVEYTFVDFVQFSDSPEEVLRDEVIEVARTYVPAKKQDDAVTAVVELFNKTYRV